MLLVGLYENDIIKFMDTVLCFKTWFIQQVFTYILRHNNFSELLQASR